MKNVVALIVLFSIMRLSVHHNCDRKHLEEKDFNNKETTESYYNTKEEEDVGSGDDTEDEEDEDDSEEDNAEAFNDIEDEDVICANYVPGERKKRLPDAVVIGSRKGGTRNF